MGIDQLSDLVVVWESDATLHGDDTDGGSIEGRTTNKQVGPAVP